MKSKFLQFLQDNITLQLELPKSSLGFRYPTLRDHPLHTADIWLRGKRVDDGAEGLWRLYDGLYDFSEFITVHPGGPDWLNLTKACWFQCWNSQTLTVAVACLASRFPGRSLDIQNTQQELHWQSYKQYSSESTPIFSGTDITEAFEAHHISTLPEKLLHQYFVKKASTPRNSPFTFEESGFYKTLKTRVRKELENVPKQPEKISKILTDIFFLFFMVTSLITVRDENYIMGTLSGLFLTMTCVAAHNFFHQRDNFRMYYFDFTLMSSRNWRVSHALSHHIYTNTIYDLEISSLEPFLQYLPAKKNYIARYGSWLYSPIFYASIYIGEYIKTILQAIIEKSAARWENYIPLLHLLLLWQYSGQPFITTLIFYIFIIIISSFFFGYIGLNAGHHHPDVFHDGDDVRSSKIDWGIHQMDSVMDRLETTGSHFLVLISFGDHALHHLFPTIDHGRLNYLYPILQEVCMQFGINLKMSTHVDLTFGQFRQLSKTEPTKRKITG